MVDCEGGGDGDGEDFGYDARNTGSLIQARTPIA